MPVLSGSDGSVILTPAKAQATIKSWSLNWVGDALETTNFDTTGSARIFIAGLTNWTGSFEGFFSSSNSAEPGATGTISLKYSAATTGGWGGSIVITGMDISTPRDGLITQAYTFQGNGKLAILT